MTIASRTSPIEVAIGKGDVRTIQRGKTWAQFEHLQQGFNDTRGVKLFYYSGTIEILMPGAAHELFKKIIAILIEVFLLDRKIEFEPTGSMTQKREGAAAAEADESYEIQGAKLCVEVNFTSGDESKLQCYRELGIDEVWFWDDGVLAVYSLQSDGYQKVNRSQISVLAPIDLAIVAECILIGETSRIEAVERFRQAHPN
ncbi:MULTISPECIES: Uma2 family endonuclease [unclassified Chamaesiphon]|uniref:Uma2 family endonuclease n=1 Tax=unclassified Chamaesiphon TaxID=2620921 RepID=UPI00286AB3C2|nr:MULTISPECIES: Uma2 family endonuclease [unclassified Chamaesiphon]